MRNDAQSDKSLSRQKLCRGDAGCYRNGGEKASGMARIKTLKKRGPSTH